MAGLSDFLAEALLNFATGNSPMPALGSRFLALFTAAPTSDAGTGGTEVSTSGTGYARVQVAGELAAGAAFTTSSTSITLSASAPSWVVAGMNVFDITANANVGTVASVSGATVTLTGDAAHASSGVADSLAFSAFPAASASSGIEPVTTPASATNTNATITFPQATVSWGTVVAWGIYDAETGGDLLVWDYLGNFKWVPFTCTSASPGVFTTDSGTDVPANGASVVVTAKFGGTLPSTSGSFAGVLTTAGASGATFNVGVNTTSTGAGEFRQVTQQSIPANVTAPFASGTLVVSAA
jgi:hypothetical protein